MISFPSPKGQIPLRLDERTIDQKVCQVQKFTQGRLFLSPGLKLLPCITAEHGDVQTTGLYSLCKRGKPFRLTGGFPAGESDAF